MLAKTYFLCLAFEQEEDKLLTLQGFLQWVEDRARQDARVVWTALFACGIDLHFDR